MLTQERLKELLEYDPESGIFTWRNPTSARVHIGDIAGNLNKVLGYIQIGLDGRLYYAHRLVFLYMYGFLPKMVDHKNRVKTDNRVKNLRVADKKLNSINSGTPRNNTSGRKGVTWDKSCNRWMAQLGITENGKEKTVYGGKFKEYKDAVAAREKLERKFWAC